MGSQARQDDFVLSLIDKGTFLDIGCYHPEKLNNTFKLEQSGWSGIAIDIINYADLWQARSTPFICADALEYDYKNLPSHIDYLSLDVENMGDRFAVLKRVMASIEFKIMTIEHDRYKAEHLENEALPQRELLTSLGYDLLCKDVMADTRPFEDWWVNPRYVDNYIHYRCDGLHCSEIMKLAK